MRIRKGAGWGRRRNGKNEEGSTQQNACAHGKPPAEINFAKIIDL
jgi:hypothetical protein